MARGALARVQETYTLERMVAKTVAVYQGAQHRCQKIDYPCEASIF